MVILVDSSIFIGWSRKGQSPTLILQPYIFSSEIVSCGIVRAEVIRGSIKANAKVELMALFDVLPEISIDARLWRDVTEMAWQLDRKGIILPLVDLIIAACALRAHATLISEDTHFAHVPHLKARKDLPRYS